MHTYYICISIFIWPFHSNNIVAVITFHSAFALCAIAPSPHSLFAVMKQRREREKKHVHKWLMDVRNEIPCRSLCFFPTLDWIYILFIWRILEAQHCMTSIQKQRHMNICYEGTNEHIMILYMRIYIYIIDIIMALSRIARTFFLLLLPGHTTPIYIYNTQIYVGNENVYFIWAFIIRT